MIPPLVIAVAAASCLSCAAEASPNGDSSNLDATASEPTSSMGPPVSTPSQVTGSAGVPSSSDSSDPGVQASSSDSATTEPNSPMTSLTSPSSSASAPSTSTGGAGGAVASAGAGGRGPSGAGGMLAAGGTPAAGGIPGSGGSLTGSAGLGGTVDAGAAGASNGGNTNVGGAPNGGNPKFLVFLLLGQSNMEGQPQPESQDREENPRIQVLGYDNCPTLPRNYGEWDTASPPMHSCGGGVGPGDYFARTLLEMLPDEYTIGLVPCAVNGAPIDLFRKDVPRTGYYLPPDDHWETGYEWIVSRAQTAQRSGVIRGILFHQGESNNGQADWVDKVSELVTDLRTDLSLGDAPFLAGELYYDGNGGGHNPLIRELTEQLDNAHLVSAEGLTGYDIWHFDLASQRELGRRYGEKMIEVLER